MVPTSTHRSLDLRVWVLSYCPKVPVRNLVEMYRPAPTRRIKVAWIWRLPALPRIRLFLWKVAWDRHPTRSLLRDRGMEIPLDCPICGMENESTEHTLLRCPRAYLV